MTHKITREYEKKMSEISPFELKNILIDLADESARKSTHIMLNAGRGNPNWISTVPREAFFRKETYRLPFYAILSETRRLSRHGTAERYLRLSCE